MAKAEEKKKADNVLKAQALAKRRPGNYKRRRLAMQNSNPEIPVPDGVGTSVGAGALALFPFPDLAPEDEDDEEEKEGEDAAKQEPIEDDEVAKTSRAAAD